MRKIFGLLVILCAFVILAAKPAFASSSVTLRVETPKTPNNSRNFPLNFVALSTSGNPITVECFKKGPSDGSFTQFGGDITLSSPGNTDDCPVNVDSDGTWQFYATATDGSNTVTSSTISVDINTSSPGTPINYSKTQVNNCDWKIHFRTADDSGKTVMVEVYRSENTSYSAGSGTRVGQISIGSNSDYDFSYSGNCGTYYYFSVRAFDNAGNGSGIAGDSGTTVTVTASPTPTTSEGAIPVVSSQVTGENPTTTPQPTSATNNGGEKQVLGKKTEAGVLSQAYQLFTRSKLIMASIITIVFILLIVFVYLIRKYWKLSRSPKRK